MQTVFPKANAGGVPANVVTRRDVPPGGGAGTRYAAVCAHAYTIAGGVFALAAFIATAERHFDRAFVFLALALVVDATDGMLARRLAVAIHWPDIDGERLDALVDFLTFVVVPAFLAVVAGVLPKPAFLWAAAMVVASLVRFSRRRTKESGRFHYLPSCWNILVFYAFYLRPPFVVVGVSIAVIIALMFTPGRFPHPILQASRHVHLAVATPAVLLGLGVIVRVLPARPWLLVSLMYPAFYGAHAAWLTLDNAARTRSAASRLRRLFSVIIGNYLRASYAR